MPHIASTLSTGMDYTFYKPTQEGDNINTVHHTVTLKGGANVAQRGTANLYTADGIVTHITDEDYDLLKTNEVFKLHEKNGFVKVLKSKISGTKAAQDMEAEDKSSPLTEKDTEKGGRLQGATIKKKIQ